VYPRGRRLSLITLSDGDLALRAAYLFCFNPASVFHRCARLLSCCERGSVR
jgi:hypothetical protein